MTYIHGAAVMYHGKSIVFTGDSRSGKSSSMMRLVNDGAKIISDDNVLFRDGLLIPFYIKTTINEDFARRFNILDGRLKPGQYVDINAVIKGIDKIIFLKMWNNNTSEMIPIDYKKALLHMMRIYKKEVQYNLLFDWDRESPEVNKIIFQKYSILLEHAKCYEFYAGPNESEVRAKLLRFFDEN